MAIDLCSQDVIDARLLQVDEPCFVILLQEYRGSTTEAAIRTSWLMADKMNTWTHCLKVRSEGFCRKSTLSHISSSREASTSCTKGCVSWYYAAWGCSQMPSSRACLGLLAEGLGLLRLHQGCQDQLRLKLHLLHHTAFTVLRSSSVHSCPTL